MREVNGLGWVYFLGHPDGSRIKVGYSDAPPRHRSVQLANSAWEEDLVLCPLAFVRATYADEQRLHQLFKPHRWTPKKKEVYRTEPLVPYITWLRDQSFVSVTFDECLGASGQMAVDSSVWMVSPERKSYRKAEGLFASVDAWAFLPTRDLTGDDYYTPPDILACVRGTLGVIDLDPATHVIAQAQVQARHFFTLDQNGLERNWFGRVYLNPPFSSWDLWAEKILTEVSASRVAELIALGFTRTQSAKYFTPLLRRVDGICIVSGRRNFWGCTSDSESAPDGVFMVYIGPDVGKFRQNFEPLGPTWQK